MSNRSVELTRLPLANPKEEGQTLDVEVRYELGGPDYFFGGNRNQRGYYLSIRPKTHEGNWVKFDLLSGLKTLLEPANRFNQKKLEQIAATAKDHEMYKKLLDAVCEQTGLELA